MEVHIQHIFREGNYVADSLAKHGANGFSRQYFHITKMPISTQRLWLFGASQEIKKESKRINDLSV